MNKEETMRARASWVGFRPCVWVAAWVLLLLLQAGGCTSSVGSQEEGSVTSDGGTQRDSRAGADRSSSEQGASERVSTERVVEGVDPVEHVAPDAGGQESGPSEQGKREISQPSEQAVQEVSPELPALTNACTSLLVCGYATCGWPYPIPCLDACAQKAGLSGAPLKRWQDLRACVLKHCTGVCDPNDNDCHANCVAASCAKEWVTCATDEKTGQSSCPKTVACTQKCAKRVGPCHADCVSAADADSQKLYTKALACYGLEQQNKQTAQDKFDCYQNSLSCLCPQHKQEGVGTGTCLGYTSCVGKCGKDDLCCWAKCRAEASKDELKAADDFSGCVTKNCAFCLGQKPCTDQCATSYCLDPYRSCVCPRAGKPGSGTKGCANIFSCLNTCSQGDLCCSFQCLAGLTATGLQRYLDLARCVPQCRCANGDKACNDKCVGTGGSCNTQAVACINDK